MALNSVIRLGTRASKLARIQTRRVATLLQKAMPELKIETVLIQTQGDADKQTPLSELGGKGVFIKSLEQALLNKEIDIAVHSMKDITSHAPEQLSHVGFLQAESIADVLILPEGQRFDPENPPKRIGTGSLRRQALLKQKWPNCETIPVRGNVETRIGLADQGKVDAVVLSDAGVIRMGLMHRISHRFDPAQFYPAPGQGVISLQTRKDDTAAIQACQAINDPKQAQISALELELLEQLSFDCSLPLGCYTQINNNTLSMTAFLSQTDLSNPQTFDLSCPISEAQTQVNQLAKQLCQALSR